MRVYTDITGSKGTLKRSSKAALLSSMLPLHLKRILALKRQCAESGI